MKDKAEMKEKKIEISEDVHQECAEEITQLKTENADLKDQLIRKVAELENFRKRTIKEKQELIEYGNEKLILRFLDIADDFENAFNAADKSNADVSLLEGFNMIFKKMQKIFIENNVIEIEEPIGKPFDVNLHEAIMMIPSELDEGLVVQQVQKGYKYGDKVIRHTKVITSRGEN